MGFFFFERGKYKFDPHGSVLLIGGEQQHSAVMQTSLPPLPPPRRFGSSG